MIASEAVLSQSSLSQSTLENKTNAATKTNVQNAALKSVRIEMAGLSALEKALQGELGASLDEAVRQIASHSGRVVVTGLGKSGHIGAKIAATLASTGTPAFFVHAAEANHGDLGMIGHDDVILALSWSGETVELQAIVNHSRRFRIPLIALTSGKESALGRAADIVLLLPKVEEACPHGLAPTTSTTMQLALGDALAVSLLEARHFSAHDFRVFHPGGKLGANLRLIRDIMHVGDELPLVQSGTSMPAAMQVLAAKHFGCVAVVDEGGKLAGIVTDGDLARLSHRDLSQEFVDNVMTRRPKTVDPDMMAAAAIALINEFQISALLVTEDGYPVGIVHFHDLLRIGAA